MCILVLYSLSNLSSLRSVYLHMREALNMWLVHNFTSNIIIKQYWSTSLNAQQWKNKLDRPNASIISQCRISAVSFTRKFLIAKYTVNCLPLLNFSNFMQMYPNKCFKNYSNAQTTISQVIHTMAVDILAPLHVTKLSKSTKNIRGKKHKSF